MSPDHFLLSAARAAGCGLALFPTALTFSLAAGEAGLLALTQES
jgi:hypothetical protein